MPSALNADAGFANAFDTFSKSAFRFEGLQTYDVEEEKKDFQDFLKGKIPVACPEGLKEWCSAITIATLQGKVYQRVRRIEFPLSDYTRFEIISGYQFSSEAGEQIRLLEKSSSDLSKDILSSDDFWLFDDTFCFALDYNSGGEFIGVRQIDNIDVPIYVGRKLRMLESAVDLPNSHSWQILSAQEQ